MESLKYQDKSGAIIEARQWNGKNTQEIREWLTGKYIEQIGGRLHLHHHPESEGLTAIIGDYISIPDDHVISVSRANFFEARYTPIVVASTTFRPVALGEVNYLYAAGEMGFTCPCGATVAIDDEPVTCTCGRLYQVRHYLEVKEAE